MSRSAPHLLSLAMLGASLAALAAAMVLGTSQAVPYFGSTSPFLTLGGSPSPAVVITLTWFAAVSAGVGTLSGLYALRRGSFVRPGRLLAAGAVAACVLALLPPAGSVDMLNYAIYGRIADLGRNPYATTPFLLSRTGDPVGVLLPSGWQRVPTVYGPITTAIQWAAAHLGGNAMAHIVFLLKWGNAVAFVGTGIVLDRLVGPDPARRVRAALLWTLNPIMLFWMVGSGHADVYAVFFLVVALYAMRRSALLAGLAGGAAVAVKASFLFPAAALVAVAWLGLGRGGGVSEADAKPTVVVRLRRAAAVATGRRASAEAGPTVMERLRRAVAAGAGLLLVGGGGYLLAGPAAIHSLSTRLGRKKDRYLPVPDFILYHHGLYTVWMAVLAVALTVFLWWRSGLPFALWRTTRDGSPIGSPAAFLPVVVVAFGTTLVSPLQYPWYDAMLLPLLAVLPRTPYARLDWLLILRGVMLGVMTLPGVRVSGYQHLGVRWANLAWLILFVAAVWWGTRRNADTEPATEPAARAGEASPAPAG